MAPSPASSPVRSDAIALVEDTLAAWRLVRLVRSDYLTQPLRDRVYDLLDGDASVTQPEPEVGTCTCGHPREQHTAQGCHAERCTCLRFRPDASATIARLRHPKLATLMECPYCLGVWTAGAVVVLRVLRADWLVRVLAVSAAASELARREARQEPRQDSRPEPRQEPRRER